MQRVIAAAVLIILMALAFSRILQHHSEGAGQALPTKMEPVNVYDLERGQTVVAYRSGFAPETMKDKLTDLEYHVAFEAGTERPFTSPLNKNKRSGVYKSIVSGNDLFHSDHKFDSGTGWPSFYRPVNEGNIELRDDNSLFMKRVEVVDAVSGAHLGHVFKDGPPPTGLRYCINGAALKFVEGVPFKEPPQ